MNQLGQKILICLYLMVLAGCATHKGMVALPKKIQKEIKSTEVYLEKCEKTIKADVDSSHLAAYTGGGLVPSLIDLAIVAHRDARAEEILVDVQKEWAAFQWEEKFQERLASILKNTSWLQVREIHKVPVLQPKTFQEIFQKTKTDCVLFSKFIYKFNPNFDVMTGTLFFTLYPVSPRMKNMVHAENPAEKPVLKFHVAATESLTKLSEDKDENAKRWAENKGEKLRLALENILNQIFVQFEKILKNPHLFLASDD